MPISHILQAWGQPTKSFAGEPAASIALEVGPAWQAGRNRTLIRPARYEGRRVDPYWSVFMCNRIKASLLFLLAMTGIDVAAAQSPSNQPRASGMEAGV